jgi:hypothetical protein
LLRNATASLKADFQPTASDAPLPLRRELQAGDPYPVEALGPLLGAAVKGAAEVIQAPLELCAQSALANVALAVQGHANVVMPFGEPRPTPISLFLLSVAESGDRKTQADKLLGGEAIGLFEQAREEEVRHERIAYQNGKEAYEAAKAQAKSRASKEGSAKEIANALDAVGDPPVEPLSATLTFSDPTIEGLHKQFSKGSPSAGLFSSEGGAFVGGIGMNQDNALKTGALLSELWDGSAIKRLRAMDGESTMRNRRLCFHLMMQPGAAHAWLSNPVLRDQGLFSRLLVAAPKSLRGTRLWREPDPADVRAMRKLAAHVGDLLDHTLPVSPDRPGELRPRSLELTADARQMFFAFYNEIEKQLAPGGRLDAVKGLGSKTCEHAARLAAVLTLADDFKATAIDRTAMGRGVKLAQWYLSEALRLADAEAFTPELLAAEEALEWLRGRPLFSLPCLYMRGPNKVRCKSAAEKVVAILLDHNQIEKVDGSHEIDGTRRRDCYRVRGA